MGKLLLAALCVFVALEVLLLPFNDVVFRRATFMYDPDLGFKIRPHLDYPGLGSSNEFGFNGPDYPHHPQPGTFRVLILGDSFNWAGWSTGNYTAILQRKFDAAMPRKVEVINAGYPYTHPGEELGILRKYGLQYNPRLVIVGFFVGNDFLEADPGVRKIVVGDLVVEHRGRELTLFGQPLVMQSRLYAFLKQRRAIRQYQRNETQRPSQAEPAGFSDWYLDLERERMKVVDPAAAVALEKNEAYAFQSLLAMRDLLASRGTPFVLVAYPDEFQVNGSLRQAVVERHRIDPSAFQWGRPQALLREFCSRHDIPFYDMLAAFQKADRDGARVYAPNDTHWNDAGNELAAQFLFDVLVGEPFGLSGNRN